MQKAGELNILPVTTEVHKKAAFDIRIRVFVEEQGVPLSKELDTYDADALHFLAIVGEKAVGTLRFRWSEKGIGKVERVAVLPEFRSDGIGSALMDAVEQHASLDLDATTLTLSAQVGALSFYKKRGYQALGEPFSECNMLHQRMEKALFTAHS